MTRTPAATRNARVALLSGALVSGAAVWLIARSVNLHETLAALTASNLWWFGIAFGLQVLASLVAVRRWQILLQPHPTRFGALTQIYFAAHLLNTALPAKLGTFARVLLAAEQAQLNVGFVLGSVALEKVLDTLVMLGLFLLLAPFAPLPEGTREALGASALVALVGVLALASVGRLREPLLHWLARAETRLLKRESQRVAEFARGILESITQLTQQRQAVRVLAWTALLWTLGIVVNGALLRALDLKVSWSAAIFLLVVLQIGTRVPALPANLGVFHYLVLLALGGYGVNENAALAYAILLHLVVFILPAFIGAACALPLSARLTRLVTDGWRRT